MYKVLGRSLRQFHSILTYISTFLQSSATFIAKSQHSQLETTQVNPSAGGMINLLRLRFFPLLFTTPYNHSEVEIIPEADCRQISASKKNEREKSDFSQLADGLKTELFGQNASKTSPFGFTPFHHV